MDGREGGVWFLFQKNIREGESKGSAQSRGRVQGQRACCRGLKVGLPHHHHTVIPDTFSAYCRAGTTSRLL